MQKGQLVELITLANVKFMIVETISVEPAQYIIRRYVLSQGRVQIEEFIVYDFEIKLAEENGK